jgi:hypothetical protein
VIRQFNWAKQGFSLSLSPSFRQNRFLAQQLLYDEFRIFLHAGQHV